jgi:hypothetical protein
MSINKIQERKTAEPGKRLTQPSSRLFLQSKMASIHAVRKSGLPPEPTFPQQFRIKPMQPSKCFRTSLCMALSLAMKQA